MNLHGHLGPPGGASLWKSLLEVLKAQPEAFRADGADGAELHGKNRGAT